MTATRMKIPKARPPTPPGEMLLEEFLKPLSMTQTELAERIGVSHVRMNEIVNGKRRVTPSAALRLARAFGAGPEFRLNGQLALDLYETLGDEREMETIEKIEPMPH